MIQRRITKVICGLFLYGCLLSVALPVSAYTGVLVGWDSGGGAGYTDVRAPGIEGHLDMDGARDPRTNHNSQDAHFGHAHPGAYIADPPNAEGGAFAFSLGGSDGSGEHSRNNRLGFRIQNETGADIILNAIHFDVLREWVSSGTQLTLRYAYGSLDNDDDTIISVTADGAIPDGFGDYSHRRISDEWGRFDFSVQGLNDFVLRDGEHAVFRIESNQGESIWSGILVDNIAISGTVLGVMGAPTTQRIDSFDDMDLIHRLSGDHFDIREDDSRFHEHANDPRFHDNVNVRSIRRDYPYNSTDTRYYIIYELDDNIRWAAVLAHMNGGMPGELIFYSSVDDVHYRKLSASETLRHVGVGNWNTYLYRMEAFPEGSRYLKVEFRSVAGSPTWRLHVGEVRLNHPDDAPVARPLATGVRIEGTPAYGEPLTGFYTYHHVAGMEKGESWYRWLSASASDGRYVPLHHATGLVFEASAESIGRYVRFEVTPVDTDGQLGHPVLSDPVGPVSGSAEVTIELLNPYAAVDWDSWERYKANLHTHTTRSDGASTPAEMIDIYAAQDYAILALTDHDFGRMQFEAWDQITYPWSDFDRDPIALGMISIPGQEISQIQHLVSLFSDYPGYGSISVKEALQEIDQRDGLSFWAHPGRYNSPVAWYVETFHTFDHLIGMEVINRRDRHSGDRALWDSVLSEIMPERPVWGLANDDSHNTGNDVGCSWNIVLLPELQKDLVRAALEDGQFLFASTYTISNTDGPVPGVSAIIVDEAGQTIEISGTAYDHIRWITEGDVVHEGETLDLTSLVAERRSYVRAALMGPGGETFTQPFGLRYHFTAVPGESEEPGFLIMLRE